MKMNQIVLETVIKTNVPCILWGDPGIGKTSFVNKIGKEMNRPVTTLIASIRDITDFSGLLIKTGDKRVETIAPSWAVDLKENSILFIDEITTVPASVQPALLRIIQERYVGEYKLPDSVTIIAAANPPSMGGNELSMPLRNRFFHYNWEHNKDMFVEGFSNGWTIDPFIELDEVGDVDAKEMMLKYLKDSSSEDRLHNIPDESEEFTIEKDYAYPTQRSWDLLSKLLDVGLRIKNLKKSDKRHLIIKLINGSIGSRIGTEFYNFLIEAMDVDVSKYLKDPSKIKELKNTDKIYHVLQAVSKAISDSESDLITYMKIVENVFDLELEDLGLLGLKLKKNLLNNPKILNRVLRLIEKYPTIKGKLNELSESIEEGK